MKDNIKQFISPGGITTPLYAEVGRFFAPVGTFDEAYFRNNLREYSNALFEKYGEDRDNENISRWFSLYINQVVEYLRDKGMAAAELNLFKSSIDELNRIGIKKLNLAPESLMRLFSMSGEVNGEGEKKKISHGDKRKKIFDAAVQVFSREGFHKATIDMIASLSGVAKGSIYRYFKSKEDLLSQLLNEKYDEILINFNMIFSKEKDVIKQIQKMIEFWVSFIEENHQVYRLIQSEAIAHNVEEGKMFYDYVISHLPMLKERIVALNIEKKIKTTSFYSVFYGILGFIDGVVYKWARNGRNYSLKDEIPVILEVLFNGFIGEKVTRTRYLEPPEQKLTAIKY